MDVKQARKEKAEIEQKITELLLDFSKRTGVMVFEIYLQNVVTIGGDVISYNIDLKVEL